MRKLQLAQGKVSTAMFIGGALLLIAGSFGAVNLKMENFTSFNTPNDNFNTSFMPPCTMAPTEIGGTIFREFEHNGAADIADAYRFAELGYAGVIVNIYDDDQVLITSVLSDADGTWLADVSAASGSRVLVEFVSPTDFKSGPTGANNSTAEIIVDLGTCNNDFTLGRPGDHCQDNPTIATACFPGPNSGGPPATIVTIEFEESDNYVGDQNTYPPLVYAGITASTDASIANETNTGFISGLAWDKTHNQILSSSFTKITSAGTSNNIGEIYSTSPVGVTNLWLDLEAIFPDAAGGSQFQDGTANSNGDPDLANIGYTGFTDIEINTVDSELYAFNAKDRSIYVIQIDQSNGSAITTGIKIVPIPAICSGSFTNGNPYAAAGGVGYLNGRVYVTTTCAGPTVADLQGAVYSFDPSVSTPAPTLEFSIDYSAWIMPGVYVGGIAGFTGGTYLNNILAPWSEELSAVNPFMQNSSTFEWIPGTGNSDFAPWAMDIEFDIHPDGKVGMNIITKNKAMDATETLNDPTNGGYMSKAALIGGSWVLESNGDAGPFLTGLNKTMPASSTTNIFMRGQDDAAFYHGEGLEGPSANGGAVTIPGFKEIMTSNTDNYYGNYDSGFSFHNVENGLKTRDVNILFGSNVGFAKGNSWGDLQAMCELPPIEIGNYVWLDLDYDGFQDPSESPQAGIDVELWKDTDDDGLGDLSLGTATTDANGYYFFGGVNDVNTSQTLAPFMTYELRISLDDVQTVNPEITQFTIADNTTDQFDSDYQDTIISGNPWAKTTITTSNTELVFHQLDAGLFAPAIIGDAVFIDVNGNGLQEMGEPGIEGVMVEIMSASTGLPVSTDALGEPITPEMTDALGTFSFQNLPEDDYYAVFDVLPATSVDGSLYVPTIENVNGVNGDPNDSDINAMGISDTIPIEGGVVNSTMDAGFMIPVSVGDTVFLDSNKNGIQDPGDTGVPGVKVTLFNTSDDSPVTEGVNGTYNNMQTTGSDGLYIFEDLYPGDYYVKFDISMVPGDYVYTLNPAGGATEATDSDVPQGAGMMGMGNSDPTGMLNSGDSDTDLDAGIVLCEVEVVLTPAEDFCIDLAGNQVISATPANGVGVYTYLWSTGATTSSITVSPTATTEYTVTVTDELGCTEEASVRIVECSNIGDLVWFDIDQDGQQDPNEPGVPGVTVYLLDQNMMNVDDPNMPGTPWSMVTDPDGNYNFDNIFIDPNNDTFFVEFSIDPAVGTLPTPVQDPDVNSMGAMDTETDSDVDITNPTTDGFTSGEIILFQDTVFTNIDAGLIGNDTIGDFVFEDTNGNGIQDMLEPGIDAVEVYLKINGIYVDTTMTEPDGSYQFADLIPNPGFEYSVQFESPSGYEPTVANAGMNDELDSDADPAMINMTEGIIFTMPDSNNMSLDAGFFEPVSLGDTVWVDANGNGIQDVGEAPLENVTVALFKLDDIGSGVQISTDIDGDILPTVTDADGYYKFENLPPGDYYVNFDVTSAANGANYVNTMQNVNGISGDVDDSDIDIIGNSDTVSVASGMMDCTLDAGYFLPVSIGDTAFVDTNYNGLQDLGEPGIPNVTVSLFDTSGTQITTDIDGVVLPTVTDANGYYKFENLAPNQYYVVFDVSTSTDPMAAMFVPTTENVNGGTLDPADSDINTSQVSDTTEVASGGMDCTLDAGYFAPVAVGDTVFVDNNGNGLQDPGEPGIEGVPISIFDVISGMEVTEDFEGNPLAPTLTDADGYYKIDSLIPGQYYVVFDVASSLADPDAADYLPTMQNANGGMLDPDDSDIDMNETSDTTAVLASGEMDCTLDAGYFVPVSVGDTTWVDDNGNGIFDDGEDPLPGVEVSLYKIVAGDSILQTEDYLGNDITGMVTDADGIYTFDTLMPGIYYVEFMEPTGSEYTLTSPEEGMDETVDSDPDIPTGTSPLTEFLESGDTDSTVDAGYFIPVSVGDTVFVDVNGNGVQDPTDDPIEDVVVTLYVLDDMGNGVQVTEDAEGNPIAPENTNPDGSYVFDNLPPGEYYVEFDLVTNVPDGTDFVPTFQNTGMDDEIDSDVNQMFISDTTNFLVSDEEDLSLDAGFFIPVSVGDTAFVDTNYNGLQDLGEPGIPNVTVSLFDTSGTQITLDFSGMPLPTVTDANGYYKFENLPPNEYYVVFDVSTSSDPDAANFVATQENIGGTLSVNDSDINTAGISDTTNVESGEMDCTLDAGYFVPVAVGDTVFVDVNGNGLQDAMEPGIDSVLVSIYDGTTGFEVTSDFEGNPLDPTYTNSDGYYKIDSLLPGSYYVIFDVDATVADPNAIDYVPTFQNVNGGTLDPSDSDIDLAETSDTTGMLNSGEMDCTLDAGYFVPVSVGDTVFVDSNGNGLQDLMEPGIPGVEVDLYKIESGVGVLQTEDYNGVDISMVVTDANGYYKFEDLAPGEYYVIFDVSTATDGNGADYVSTFENINGGTLDALDSDVNALGFSDTTNLIPSGEMDCTLDAGYFVPVAVGDTVFVDNNGNGLQDNDEPGLEGVQVDLYQVVGGVGILQTTDYLGNDITMVSSDADGYFKFENLAPGVYYVIFDKFTATDGNGAEYLTTLENINGTLDASDSDIDLDQESDTTLLVSSGNMDCTLDAGYFLPVSVGDTVFVDDNGNGIQDIGELGLENVSVDLYKVEGGVGVLQTEDYNGNDITSVITDGMGYYKFENLAPGQYYVDFDVTTAAMGDEYYGTYANINGGSLDPDDSDIDDMNSLSDTTAVMISNEMDCTLDAGYFLPVSIGDTAWIDVNLNGIQEFGEPGLEGIIVTCFYYNPLIDKFIEVTADLNGNPVTPIPTKPDGSYLFDSLPPGIYHVNFDSDGIPPTEQDVNDNMLDEQDSDIDEFGNSDTLLITSGMNNTSFDAGYEGLDYGDLPDEYITTDANNMGNAPKHVMIDGKFLGSLVDQDSDGVPTADGQGDDLAGSPYILPDGASGDDEDGVEFLSPMIPGNVAYVKITYTTQDGQAIDDAFINAFIDFDGDMVLDAVEFVEVDGSAIATTTNLGIAGGADMMIIAAFNVPETATFRDGNAYVRVRMSCAGGLASTGLALDGEVEDYVVPLGKIGNLVWQDENFDGLQDLGTPEPGLEGVEVVLSYDYDDANATFTINDTIETLADGSYYFCGLLSSDVGIYQITVITPEGLAASMPNIPADEELDSDNDLEFGEEGRDSVQTNPFMISDVTMLPMGENGQSDMPNMVGTFPDDQVDQTYDFAFVPLDFGDLPEMDFGDLPISYATTEDGNVDPPRHVVTSNKRLGSCVDSEPDGQPDEMGMGDDDNMDDTDEEFSFGDCTGGSDEDGIEFLTPLIPGDTAYMKITYTLPPAADGGNIAGYLNGWIDYDGNGLLLNTASLGPNSNDQIRFFETTGFAAGIQRPNFPLEAGNDVMKIVGFEVPETATFNGGTVFSRFRLSCEGGLLPVGILQDGSIPEGEVEDYVVPLTKVGNLVWLDQNYDGIQDTSAISLEEGIEDVSINLTYTYVDVANNIDLTISVDTITDEDGKYNFCGLLPNDIGEYEISVISPEFLTPTVADNPSVTDSLDSDHAVNEGDSLVTTGVFQITESIGLPLGEDGIEDDPNVLGTFPDSLFDQTYDFGFTPLDYGDLDSTFITAIEDGGPVHVISESKFLGLGSDAERTAAVDSLAGATVDGDDNEVGYVVPEGAVVTDDEDGIEFITPLIPGFKATISVNYTLVGEDGFLNGWIDFDGNGLLDAGEALEFYSDGVAPSKDGILPMAIDSTVELCFDVPDDAVYNEGDVHARFRLSCEGGLEPIGGFPMPEVDGPQAPQGEVEDYFVPLAKIGNLAWYDNDLDGEQDGNVGVNPEIGVPMVNNTLVFAGYQSTVFEDADDIEYPVQTDGNGNYYVCGLIEGSYNMIPTKYEEDAITPADTIPVRYILTIPNNLADDNSDSDFAPNLIITIPDLLVNDLILGEDGYTDDPGNIGFPDEQDQVNFDQGWIPEPNIEAVTNIAGFDYPESGSCRHFNIIADVCVKNTGYIEMNGELIGANLTNLVADIDLGAQFNDALIGVVGDPLILTDLGYDGGPVTNPVDLTGFPNPNGEFDGTVDINAFNNGGFLAPDEEVCLRIVFEINPTVLPFAEALALDFNAVLSANAVNDAMQEIPDFFNGGEPFVAVDSSDMNFEMFDGTYEDPDVPSLIGDCWDTTKDLNQHSTLNISYDENCEALITPEMLLTTYVDGCYKTDYPLGGFYRMRLEDLNGNVIIDYTECLLLDDPAYVGNMYNISTQTISEACNSTWGKVTIENKFDPVLECVSDTITCGELINLAAPTVVNNCGDIEVKLINETFLDVGCTDAELQQILTQTWVAVDLTGTRSDTCTQTLSISKFDVDEIMLPFNLDTILSCSGDYPLDENGHPHPSVMGVPTLGGVDLWPNQFIDCNVYIQYDDEAFNFGNDCTSGIQRTWTISNWVCGTDNTRTIGQLITFIDTTGPVLSDVPDDMTLSTSGTSCEAEVVIPAITLEDECNNNNTRVNISYGGGFIEDANGATIGLTAGSNTVTYIVYDDCGNSSTASYNVTVQDLAQPVTICDGFTTVALNTDGLASLTAEKLDDGSFDECGPVTLEIRRMTVQPGYEDDLNFGPDVDFNCDDIGSDVQVVLQVTDVSGNLNMCTGTVEVQDKLPIALVVGLPDITVACTFPYDEDNMDVFGKVVNDPDDREAIELTSDSVAFSGPALDALVIDNCTTGSTSEIVNSELNNCGIGYMDRVITAMSPAGETVSITQRITFVNPSPFVLADIEWPEDYTTGSSCAADDLLPENLPTENGYPILTEDICDMVSSTYQDRILMNTPDGGGCVLIERSWYVSDWCQKVNGQFIEFKHLQLITITNNVAPVIDAASCRDTLIESIDVNCSDIAVTLTASATDDCAAAEDLIWSYDIDFDSNGSIDSSGVGNVVSDAFGVGRHSITWLVSDGCGNEATCTEVFELINQKAPSAKCFNGLSAALTPMDTSGNGTIDAEMFRLTPDFLDAGSDHTCGYDLTLSFSSDVNDTLRMYNCVDQGQQAVQLWATDVNGNQSFCSTFIIVEDNNDVDLCEGISGLLAIGGSIETEEQVSVVDVQVYLQGTDLADLSDENGDYSFAGMPAGGDYQLTPTMNKEPLNGVSTLDLVLIQQHILGKTILSSPYKLLAADINNNGSITGADLIELRKMILGIYDEFPNNTSWRFVDATHTFIDALNPWGQIIPEQYAINDLTTNMNVDFTGLKVGDVNGTVQMSGQSNSVARSVEQPLVFSYEDVELKKGEVVTVPMYAKDIARVQGYQFTLNVDGRKAELVKTTGVSAGLTELNFGDRYVSKGLLTSSWHRTGGITTDNEAPLFELTIKVKEDGILSEILELSNEITRSEAYDMEGNIMEVELGLRNGAIIEDGAELFQNRPNPWITTSVITFKLPKATQAKLLIYDLAGKLVVEHRAEYTRGTHEYKLNQADFSSAGVYYYELITDEFKLSKKMVLLK